MIRKLGMSLIVVLGMFGIGELGARLIWSVPDLSLSPENVHLVDHPTRLWVQAPNGKFSLPEHGSLTTNELGLRHESIAIPKPINEYRILSLGESSTWGHGVKRSETYSARLEAMLSASGRAANVINAGVPAYTIQQSAVYLDEEGPRLQPDVVLVYHQTNDFLPSGGIDAHNPLVRLTATDREMINRRRPLAPLLTVLFKSRLYLALRNGFLRLPSSLPDAASIPNGPVRVPTEDRVDALDSMLQSANSVGARLAFVQPLYAIDHTQDTVLRDWCARNQQLYIETADIRAQLGPLLQQWFFPDGVHPRPAAHRLIAERIAQRLP